MGFLGLGGSNKGQLSKDAIKTLILQEVANLDGMRSRDEIISDTVFGAGLHNNKAETNRFQKGFDDLLSYDVKAIRENAEGNVIITPKGRNLLTTLQTAGAQVLEPEEDKPVVGKFTGAFQKPKKETQEQIIKGVLEEMGESGKLTKNHISEIAEAINAALVSKGKRR